MFEPQLLDPTGANQDRGDLHGANPLFIAAKYGQANGWPLLLAGEVKSSGGTNNTRKCHQQNVPLDVSIKS